MNALGASCILINLVSHFLDSILPSDVCQGDLWQCQYNYSHSEPVPHVSLRTEEKRADPVPVYTPTGPVSLATIEGGMVKQRHGRASDEFQATAYIAGNFQGSKYSWFSNI